MLGFKVSGGICCRAKHVAAEGSCPWRQDPTPLGPSCPETQGTLELRVTLQNQDRWQK